MAEAVSAAPVATRYTYEFVRGNLSPGRTRILEIGCGSGELASRLLADGLEVVAIDSSEQCVAAAKAAGVEARVASWPAKIDQKFDAVLFTRSLHHIHELDEAVAAAAEALRPDGRIIVEDFRAEGGSARSSQWFLGLARLMLDAGALEGATFEDLAAKLETGHGHHELHGSAAIETSLAARVRVQARDSAYYFRYFEPYLPGGRASEALLSHELELIGSGAIDPLGRRFVASV